MQQSSKMESERRLSTSLLKDSTEKKKKAAVVDRGSLLKARAQIKMFEGL